MTKKLAQLLFFIYILGLIWLVLFKLSFHPLSFLEMTNTRSLNLTPLAMSGGRREVLFNILAFIPFGILLTMNAPKISFLNKLAISILLSFSFESLQYLLASGPGVGRAGPRPYRPEPAGSQRHHALRRPPPRRPRRGGP